MEYPWHISFKIMFMADTGTGSPVFRGNGTSSMDSQCKHQDVEPHAAPPAHPMCGLDSKHKSSSGTKLICCLATSRMA